MRGDGGGGSVPSYCEGAQLGVSSRGKLNDGWWFQRMQEAREDGKFTEPPQAPWVWARLTRQRTE
jgi:hypothetical protein